jgi:NADPH:quinone reductase-like Zn-dependent oxidoreductase
MRVPDGMSWAEAAAIPNVFVTVTFRTHTPEESLQCSERFAAHLLDAVAKGALKPVLDRTFPFERLADAHKYMLSDGQTGKIVLMVGDGR